MSNKKKNENKEKNDGLEEREKDKKDDSFGISEAPKNIPGNEKGNLKIIVE